MYIFRNRNCTYYSRFYFPTQWVKSGYPKEVRFSLRTKVRSIAIDRSLVILQSARSLVGETTPETSVSEFVSTFKETISTIVKNGFVKSDEVAPSRTSTIQPVSMDPRSITSNVSPSVSVLLSEFVEYKQLEGVKPKNVDLLSSRINNFFENQTVSPDTVTPRHASAFLKSLYGRGLSAKTVRDYLAAIRQFYSWMITMEYATVNPFENVRVKKDVRLPSEQRRRWSREELVKLFSHDNFAGVIGTNDSTVNYQKKLEDYWIPYLLLFTGARVSEICQLRTEDVQEREGVWCISVNEDEGKTVKTKASIRHIPLHKELLNMGFLSYVNHRYGARKDKLFDIRPYGKTMCWSEQFGKRFTKVLKAIGLTGAQRPTLHGLRHTFVDSAQAIGLPENEVSEIVGHAKQSMTYGRYGKRLSLLRLKRLIDEIDFGFVPITKQVHSRP